MDSYPYKYINIYIKAILFKAFCQIFVKKRGISIYYRFLVKKIRNQSYFSAQN